LTLQMENRRLKKEAMERDDKLKQTLARMARAEEAAKRAALASAGNRSPGASLKGSSASARLFAAEQRVTELEEEARELTRKLQREHERGVHFKNMCKEYKVKLDEALKAARAKPSSVLRGAGPEFPAPRAKPTTPPPANSARTDERVADQLRQERMKTAALVSERDELRRLLHAAGGKVPASRGASVSSKKKSGSEWVLEHFTHERQPYLLDRATLKVYTVPQSDDDWPEPVGRLVGGRLRVPPRKEDLFKLLDAYLKREQIHLKEAFDRFDSDSSGAMSSAQLGRFLNAVMPGVSVAQQRYFRAMCDINNDGRVTYQEMVESLKSCIGIGEDVATKGSIDLEDMIKRLREYISTSNATVASVFNQFDKDHSGALEQAELIGMFEKLVPNVTLKEKRYLLAHVAKLDLDGDGKISLAELRKALRAVKTKIEDSPAPAHEADTHAGGYVAVRASGQLVLKEHMIQGKMYLLDDSRMVVYEALSAPDAWLRPLGKVRGGVISRPATGADLVATLDATLKATQARLKDVFDSFDARQTGSLETAELAALLKKLLPAASAADLAFFQTLLDVDGNGVVAYDALVTRMKDVVAASHAFSERANMGVERILQKLRAVVKANSGDVRGAFARAGQLTYAQTLALFANLVPGSAQDRRLLAAFAHRLDVDGVGAVSYEDVAYALRIMHVVILGGDGVTPSVDVPQPRQGTASEWYLEDIVLNGQTYLLDRHNMRVYAPPTGASRWPQLAGKLQGRTLVPNTQSQEQRFVTGLDNFLKAQHSRLKDVFDTFDVNRTGTLDKSEAAAFIRALLPDATGGDVQYFSMLLDINCDGVVSYNEFVTTIKEAVAAGALVAAPETGTAPEIVNVLSILKDYIASKNVSLAQAFDQFDEGKTGFLTQRDLMNMVKTLVPALSPAERRHIIHHLRSLDADGDGRVTLAELYQAFRLSEVKRVGGASSATAPAYPTSAQAAASFDKADTSAVHQAKQAGEVAFLRQQLQEAKARCGELERALETERESGGKGGGNDGATASFSTGELQGEIKSAWERAGVLQKRYHEAQSALGTMKANHTRVLQQLDDTHKRLNQERKENLKLSAEEKRLGMELEAARELEPMLEQARAERLALEKENHQLLAAAMNAPSEAQSETRRMRSLMAEAQRERAAAELREADLKRTIHALGGGGVEGAAMARQERDRLRVDCSRMEVELEAANDKIRVLMEMGGSAALAEKKVTDDSELALADDGMDEGTLRAELRGLRETYADQVDELRKAQKLLQLEEQQVEDLRAALRDEKQRADKLNENLYRKVQSLENELDRRQKKIHKLEAQLRNSKDGGSMVELPEAKTMRASREGGTVRMSSKAEQDDLADLAPDENIFELRLLGVDIDGAALGEEDPATFMTVDFFEHETQATAVQQGLTVTADHTLQYVVKVDDFFLEYMDTKRLPVELNKSLGMDFATVGVARLNLGWVLDDALSGHGAESPPVHFCDVIGRDGKVIARLRYAGFMRKNIVSAVREYRANPPAKALALAGSADPSARAYSAAYAEAAEEPFSTAVRVEISCCRDLVPRVGSASAMVPYCSYQFPGLPGRDTSYGRGANPDFHDAEDLPVNRTREAEAKLAKAAMEIIAFDDADADLEGAGVIGIARVDLEPLSRGLPVQGAFPLFSQNREARGTVYVSVAWKDAGDFAAPAHFQLPPPATAAARVSEMAADPMRFSREMEEDVAASAKAAPPSPMSVSLADGAKGRQRYGDVADSVDASSGWKGGAGDVKAPVSAVDTVVVSIGQFELGKQLFHDHRVRQMFMLFEFMPNFHRDDEQQTMRVKKESNVVDFAYTKAFPMKDSGLRAALAALMKKGDEEEATIPFCLVSDDNGIDFQDVGFFEIKLADIYENGDYLDRRVQVLDKNDVPIGRVTVSVMAQEALRAMVLMAGEK